ncbi:spore coat CotO family protein [Bacillus paramycoides]|uniref:CotO family spore coat protein n=1 Tax=Bacillus paramycoides TaxID=2026194 RepID=UPI002243DE2B|nr:CotO family spore coat protein [Bacillus paramycoides]MCW9130651.1 spore coat CotO family protein [Bacillus paramycoides]
MEVGGTSVKNKNKSSTVGKPLLYIAQVNLELAAPKIKRIILTNFENDDRHEQLDRNQSIVSSVLEETVEEKLEQEEHRVEEEQVRTVPHNKSFKNMSNEEKINFLLNRPHYIPKVRCRIKTATISYVGSIISYQNGVVSIMPSNSMRDIKLPIKEIISIDMAGL